MELKKIFSLLFFQVGEKREYENTCRCDRGDTALDFDSEGTPRGNCTGSVFTTSFFWLKKKFSAMEWYILNGENNSAEAVARAVEI